MHDSGANEEERQDKYFQPSSTRLRATIFLRFTIFLLTWYILLNNAKRQYWLTWQVNSYCLLVLKGGITQVHEYIT